MYIKVEENSFLTFTSVDGIGTIGGNISKTADSNVTTTYLFLQLLEGGKHFAFLGS